MLSFDCQRLSKFFSSRRISVAKYGLNNEDRMKSDSDGKQMAMFKSNFSMEDLSFILLRKTDKSNGLAALLVLLAIPSYIFFSIQAVHLVECFGSSTLAIHFNLVTYLNYAWLWRKFHISPFFFETSKVIFYIIRFCLDEKLWWEHVEENTKENEKNWYYEYFMNDFAISSTIFSRFFLLRKLFANWLTSSMDFYHQNLHTSVEWT